MTLTPTQQEKITALKNAMDKSFVNESDIATSFSDNPSDAKVASEKLVKDSLDNHTHTKSQITDFPTIPSKTSQLTNDSGFLTTHQSLSNYLQQSDVKNNLTSTDTNKPLSAKQGKELKTLVDGKANSSHTHTTSEITNFPSLNDYVNKTDMSLDSDFLENFLQTLIDYGKTNDKEWINL